MKNLLIFVLLIGLMPTMAWAKLAAKVDRNDIGLGETITLLLVNDDSQLFTSPELDVLEKDFSILNNSKSSQYSLVNGKSSSLTRWEIILSPKRTGNLQIPAIEVGSETTAPINIRVNEARKSSNHDPEDVVFMEADVDRDSAYTGSQILYKLRIFHRGNLASGSSLSEPAPDNASIHKVFETEYMRKINGLSYRVVEYTYAIFPSQPGQLEIPAALLNAQVVVDSNRSMFGRTRRVVRRSDSILIDVKPLPQQAVAADAVATEKLSLSDKWSKPGRTLEVGESLTRTIIITAEGSTVAQLPPLFMAETKGVKLYRDQPQLEEHDSSYGLSAERIESIALVATAPGEIEIPEVTVNWFDTTNGQLRQEILPPVTLRVVAAASTSNTSAVGSAKDGSVDTTAVSSQAADPKWQWIALGMTLLWLLTLASWWFAKRRADKAVGIDPEQFNTSKQSTAAALKVLKKRTGGNEPAECYTALIDWSKLQWPQERINNLVDLAPLCSEDVWQQALDELEDALYSPNAKLAPWTGKTLHDALMHIENMDVGAKNSALKELYPD
ncbi:MAG: BatD family protein [Pseudomonadales bacterium]